MVSILKIVTLVLLFGFAIMFGFNAYYFTQADKDLPPGRKKYNGLVIANYVMLVVAILLFFYLIFAWKSEPAKATSTQAPTMMAGVPVQYTSNESVAPVGPGPISEQEVASIAQAQDRQEILQARVDAYRQSERDRFLKACDLAKAQAEADMFKLQSKAYYPMPNAPITIPNRVASGIVVAPSSVPAPFGAPLIR